METGTKNGPIATLRTLGAIAAIVVLAVASTWFIGNYTAILKASSPREAVIIVLANFGLHPNRERMIIREVARNDDPAPGRPEWVTYLVIEDEKEIARVNLANFLGLGWQEFSFERLGQEIH